jgi:type II secretory pathway pseudopilin PulG
MNEQIRITRLPWREAKALQARVDSETIPRYAILSSIVLPVFSRSQAKRDQTQAEVGACRIILGLQVYKQRYGTYPQALDGLRSLGWDVPEDPFSGRDFVYKRRDGRYLLYSIGQDLKDDGARTFSQWEEVAPPTEGPPPAPTAQPGPAPAPAPPVAATPGVMAPPGSAPAREPHEYTTPDGRWADDIIWASER